MRLRLGFVQMGVEEGFRTFFKGYNTVHEKCHRALHRIESLVVKLIMQQRRRSIWKLTSLIAIVLVAVASYFLFGDLLTLEMLRQHERGLKQFAAQNPVLTFGIAFAIYVAVTSLSLPGAGVMSLAYGWFFNFWTALILVNLAATTGATIAFLLSRYLLRDVVQQRFGERLAGINRAFEREGAFYLFALRLTPAAPFFLINLGMGLTTIRTWTFCWVTQIGMIPGGAVFVYAGASVPDVDTLAKQGAGAILTPQLVVAFVLLGVTPLLLKKLLVRFYPRSVEMKS